MSDDGAQLGYGAGQALVAVMGGDQPSPEERMSVEQMHAAIMATTWPIPADVPDSEHYSYCSNYTAKLILQWIMADTSRAQGPVENIYAVDADGKTDYMAQPAELGWYDCMKADGVPIAELGITGFMWGWAANAARRCLELPEVPNPAILEM